MRRSPLRNKTPLRRKKPLRAANRFPSKGDPGAATAANEAVPVSLEALRFQKPSHKAKAAPKPIKRSWMKKKRARRIDRETPREKIYKAWIHTQPCCGDGMLSPLGIRHRCNRRIEQSHERNMTGLGLKSNNLRSVAMCGDFADEWEEHRGFFANWGKPLRRDWFSARVREANARFDAEHPEAA